MVFAVTQDVHSGKDLVNFFQFPFFIDFKFVDCNSLISLSKLVPCLCKESHVLQAEKFVIVVWV